MTRAKTVKTVKTVKMAHLVRKGHKGFRVLWASKVFPVSRDLKERKALRDRMEPAKP